MPEFFKEFPAGYGDYMGTVSQMDAQIGRLRQLLQDRGLTTNTLLWFTSDNGGTVTSEPRGRLTPEDANGHLRQCKGSVFEGGVHVSGLLEWPERVVQNTRVPTPVSTVDLLPTLLHLLDVKSSTPDWPLDGTSLLPLLDAAAAGRTSTRPPIGVALKDQSAWIDGDMKLVLNPSAGMCGWEPPFDKMSQKERQGPFLYNITADPRENHDLSAAHPSMAASMHKELSAWLQDLERSGSEETKCAVRPTEEYVV